MKELVLGDSLEVLIDHRGKTPKKLGADFVEDGVPVASAILVNNGTLNLDDARYVSEDVYRKWMPVSTRKGDVLLTSEAPLGRVARVPSDAPLVLGQRLFGLRGKPGILDTGFLYYALQTERLQNELVGRSTGTTVVGIRQSALRGLRLLAPAYDEQLAIAEVLSALDDKIASNSALAKTADELARALFSESVRAVEVSDRTFDDVASVGGGGTPSSKVAEYWRGDINWATPTDVTALEGPYLFETERRISEVGLANCSSPLYPAGSILMTSRATIGAFAWAQEATAVNQGFIVVVPGGDVPAMWLFHEMRSRVPEFTSMANGATFLELSRGNFKKFGVRLADPAVMARFDEQATALHDRAAAALKENACLKATRDALLPGLMSGKLRVRDAERVAEEVA